MKDYNLNAPKMSKKFLLKNRKPSNPSNIKFKMSYRMIDDFSFHDALSEKVPIVCAFTWNHYARALYFSSDPLCDEISHSFTLSM